MRAVAFLFASIIYVTRPVVAQELAEGQVNIVASRLAESARRSWELGTRAQAILEHNATRYSVFASNDLPPPANVPGDQQGPLSPFWAIARQTLQSSASGAQPGPFMGDSAVADPPSLGVAMLLANWTNLDDQDEQYERAAMNQMAYLWSREVPKTGDGAISHRLEQAQLWSDSVYMVPPFMAYYGVVTKNRTMLEAAFNQIKVYRANLQDGNTGLWKHIVGGSSGTDDGLWATGNAWAAAGMLRVYATIDKSEFSGKLKGQKSDLKKWVNEIHKNAYDKFFDGENRFRNYLNNPNSFRDNAATALLAATVYRASLILDTHTYIPHAERSRLTLFTPNTGPYSNKNYSGFSNYEWFTNDGWLRSVVNPVNFGQSMPDGGSPEAQAFVVMMHSAWRDWRWAGEKGKSAANGLKATGTLAIGATLGSLLLGMMLA